MRRLVLVSGMLVLASSVVLGATENVVVGAVNLNKPMGVRQLGAAGVGIGNGGVMAMWSNPAFIMDMETKGEASIGGGAMNDGNESLVALGGGWKFGDNWAVGGFFGNNGVNFKEMDGLGQETSVELNDSTMAFGAGGAYRWKWLTAGATFKIVSQTLIEQSYMAPCGDLGLSGNWAGFTGGISFRNLGGRLIQPDNDETKYFYPDGVSLPTELRLGGSYTFPAIRLTPALEFRSTTDRGTVMGLSVNWWANNWLALRTGFAGPVGASEASSEILYPSKPGDDSGTMTFAFGLTALYRQFGLNFGFETAQTGASARLDLTYAIGDRAGRQEEAREPEPEKQKEEVRQVETPAPSPVAGAKKLNFAIADLRGENVSAGDAAVMADLLRNELVKTEQFTVIEKQNMDKVLSEHAFQQTGCSSEECAVKLGKLLNVQRMAVGSFGKLMDSYILSIRVVNVETGAIIYADSAEGEKVSQLRGGVRDMAMRMAKKIR